MPIRARALGVFCVGGCAMSRADAEKRPKKGARDNNRFSCPACALELLRFIIILDTCKGQTVRLFKCECGELIWDD